MKAMNDIISFLLPIDMIVSTFWEVDTLYHKVEIFGIFSVFHNRIHLYNIMVSV